MKQNIGYKTRTRVMCLHVADLQQEIVVGDTIGPHQPVSVPPSDWPPLVQPRKMTVEQAQKEGLVGVSYDPDGQLYEVKWTDYL